MDSFLWAFASCLGGELEVASGWGGWLDSRYNRNGSPGLSPYYVFNGRVRND